ncbi:MAG: DUF3310 domain-containing protein [Synergistaceae bacterium]|nr:DUF3310 domain-containing protein [Synergistaceae bacterium]MBR0076293.1 DUF3310 domain-containing protein [Synergistaceae bacterium]
MEGERMSDNIHPSHYQLANGVEVIDFIEALGLGAGFELGNAIKYISRAGKKKGEDVAVTINKAIWYLNRFIEKYSKEETKKHGKQRKHRRRPTSKVDRRANSRHKKHRR